MSKIKVNNILSTRSFIELDVNGIKIRNSIVNPDFVSAENHANGVFSFAGGYNSVANGSYSFVYGENSIAENDTTIVLGSGLTGTSANTVYVNKLNINTFSSGSSVNSLGIDANGEITINSSNVRHWEENNAKTINSDETIVISGDYVLINTDLELQKDTEIIIGGLTFNKFAQIYIGGDMLLLNSNIINDGLIDIAGAIIFSGNSTITGTGILK